MKKLLILVLVLMMAIVGCSNGKNKDTKDETKAESTKETATETKKEEKTETKTEAKKDDKKIVVASHTSPMTDMLELVKDDLKAEGYELELMKVSDNVQANVAVNNKEADANFFQHAPFMEQFNKGNNAKLVKVADVYNANVSLYSKTVKSLKDLKEGATIAIPNDPTNAARALLLLNKSGLIELDKTSFDVTMENIKNNPKKFNIKQWGLLNLNEAYQESDLIFNYPTYISKLGLKPETDGLAFEEAADKTFAIGLVSRDDNKDSEKIKALKKALNSEKIKKFIEEKLKGHAKPAF